MYSIIICDDEAAIRDGLSKYIAWDKLGFRVIALCENGQQVLDMLTVQQVDVVLCDIRMPGMSGLDVARTIHQRQLPTTVVLLSAYREFEYAQEAMAYGVWRYVVKSARFAELLEIFEQLRQELDAKHEVNSDSGEPVNADQVIVQAVDYMIANLKTATLETVAAHLNRSPAHISRYFREHAPEGFGETLTRLRMECAARLLCDIRVKTYEVSEYVGYASPKSFSRTFISFYGVSPREYRSRHLEGGQKPQ